MSDSIQDNGKVLIIDDSFIMRRVLRNALEQLGIDGIIEAEDARAALALITEYPIRIILADWNMPNMDGLSLLKLVRSEEETKDIPFVMITGRNTKEDIQDAILLGVDDYLLKPVKAHVLQEKLMKFLPELKEIENQRLKEVLKAARQAFSTKHTEPSPSKETTSSRAPSDKSEKETATASSDKEETPEKATEETPSEP